MKRTKKKERPPTSEAQHSNNGETTAIEGNPELIPRCTYQTQHVYPTKNQVEKKRNRMSGQ